MMSNHGNGEKIERDDKYIIEFTESLFYNNVASIITSHLKHFKDQDLIEIKRLIVELKPLLVVTRGKIEFHEVELACVK